MTGQENFTRAIEFRGPAYLPGDLWVNLDWLHERDDRKRQRIAELQALLPADRLDLWETPRNQHEQADGKRQWTDEWGTGWEDDGHGAKTTAHPLSDGYRDWPAPDPNATERCSWTD